MIFYRVFLRCRIYYIFCITIVTLLYNSKYIFLKPCVLPKRSLLTHPLRLPLRLQDYLLLLAGTATWLGNPRPKSWLELHPHFKPAVQDLRSAGSLSKSSSAGNGPHKYTRLVMFKGRLPALS